MNERGIEEYKNCFSLPFALNGVIRYGVHERRQ